ncbi:uncharacterized protein [Hetaerina americana]|uniref:uncharacterized protein isoform X2 n=1 Tax=Hetaerina americana TaxID=62018 RepID=UPI003A7F4A06
MSVICSQFQCRLCQKTDTGHVNVFDASRADGIMVYEVIQELIQIEVNENDGLPSTACRDCCTKLIDFSDFKKMCIRSARELKIKRLTEISQPVGARLKLKRGKVDKGRLAVCTEVSAVGPAVVREGGLSIGSGVIISKVPKAKSRTSGRISPETEGSTTCPVTIKQERESDEEEVITDDFTTVNRGAVPKEEAAVRIPNQTEVWRVAGADGRVQRPSQTLPVEVFVKVGEDCGLPLKSDGSPVERDPLSMSEEALPCTLITMSDDRVYREERFSESSLVARNPIILQRVLKQEVGEDPLGTSSLSVADTSVQRGRINTSVPVNGIGCTDILEEIDLPICGYNEHLDEEPEISAVSNQEVHIGVKDESLDLSENYGKEEEVAKVTPGEDSYGLEGGEVPASFPNVRIKVEEVDVDTDQPAEELGVSVKEEESISDLMQGIEEPKNRCGTSRIWTASCDNGAAIRIRDDIRTASTNLNGNHGTKNERNYVDGVNGETVNQSGSGSTNCGSTMPASSLGSAVEVQPSANGGSKKSSANNKIQCTICKRKFNTVKSLKVHMYAMHLGVKRTPEPEVKVKRIRSTKPKTCEVCLKTFKSAYQLADHKFIHTDEKPYSCDVCSKTFKKKAYLTSHLAVHSSKGRFQCAECKKTYRGRAELKRHVLIHAGIKKFKCDVCNRAFGQKHQVSVHMRLHTGVRPFPCSVCDKTFRRRDQAKSHMASSHGGVPAAIVP